MDNLIEWLLWMAIVFGTLAILGFLVETIFPPKKGEDDDD